MLVSQDTGIFLMRCTPCRWTNLFPTAIWFASSKPMFRFWWVSTTPSPGPPDAPSYDPADLFKLDLYGYPAYSRLATTEAE